jgi:hypothetical protein
MGVVMTDILERFDTLAGELRADPQAVRQKIEAALIEEHGQEWFDAHKASIEAEWVWASHLLGFRPDASPSPD